MKLILANNESARFVDFYRNLQTQSGELFDYANYKSLLFEFDSDAARPAQIVCTTSGKTIDAYDGVYINGYLTTYELAATVALVCKARNIPFLNHEFSNPPSLSKLSSYAKLAAAGVRLPRTIAGSRFALQAASAQVGDMTYPAVLKRADADRGIDNFKVAGAEEVLQILTGYEERSLWILQEFVANDGFYVVSFYNDEPKFCIFRTLEERPDGNERKAHMYKPYGGANASLLDAGDIPRPLLAETTKAIKAMDRQIGSVDCLYDASTGQTHVLEVNYNPQLVTITTFKDVRVKAFLDNLRSQW